MAYTTSGVPYVQPTDAVSDYPNTSLELADFIENMKFDVMRSLTPIGTVIPYAGDWGTGYANLADPEIGAPFHLPCTGGVYESDDFPLLSRALTDSYGVEGHAFIDGTYHAPTHDMIESGRDINAHSGGHSDPFWDESGGSLTGDPTSWRPDTSVWLFQDGDTTANPTTKSRGWHRITLKGFAVPDFRGRSPVGQQSLNDAVVGYSTALGQRQGDWRTKAHSHAVIPNQYANSSAGGTLRNPGTPHEWNQYSGQPMVTQNTNSNGNSLAHGVRRTNITEAQGTGPDDSNLVMVAYHHSIYINEMYAAHGASHHQPQTVVNFLIFTGQVVQSHAPKSTGLRDGSAYRIQPVTTEQMIHQRLADPDLSDEEREALEEHLASV